MEAIGEILAAHRPQWERDPNGTRETFKPKCPICEDTHYCRVDVPLGHPDFGKPIICACVDLVAAQAEWVRRQLPGALRGKTFSNFALGHEVDGTVASPKVQAGRKEALQHARAWAKDGGWLCIQGIYGTGKSHLAAAAVEVLARRGETVVFGCVPDILDQLRAHVGSDSYMPFMDGLRTAPWLVLDDLGMERETEWVTEKLEQLLDYRTRELLPTLITTNLRMDQLPGRMASRIRRCAIRIVIA